MQEHIASTRLMLEGGGNLGHVPAPIPDHRYSVCVIIHGNLFSFDIVFPLTAMILQGTHLCLIY